MFDGAMGLFLPILYPDCRTKLFYVMHQYWNIAITAVDMNFNHTIVEVRKQVALLESQPHCAFVSNMPLSTIYDSLLSAIIYFITVSGHMDWIYKYYIAFAVAFGVDMVLKVLDYLLVYVVLRDAVTLTTHGSYDFLAYTVGEEVGTYGRKKAIEIISNSTATKN